jgi:hypothetical protein
MCCAARNPKYANQTAAESQMHRLGLVCPLLVSLSAPLIAQTPTGTIAGTVADQLGAVLPNATVAVTNKNTGATRIVQTGVDGTFSGPALAAGIFATVSFLRSCRIFVRSRMPSTPARVIPRFFFRGRRTRSGHCIPAISRRP